MTAEVPADSEESVAGDTARRRASARATLGVTGEAAREKLGVLLRRHDLSLYPLVALGLLSVVNGFQGQALPVLIPEISRSLGVGVAAIGAVVAVKSLASIVAPLPMAALAQRGRRRAVLCLVTAAGWSVLTFSTGLVTSVVGLGLILVADGLAAGSIAALHGPLLMDSYHPEARVRVLSLYAAFGRLGDIVSPLLVGMLAGPLDLGWRQVFMVLGAICTATTLCALRLEDPGLGRWDTERLREGVRDVPDEPVARPGFWAILRDLLRIPTIRRLLLGFSIVGALAVPLAVFVSLFLDERFHLGPTGRGVFFGYQAAVSILALALYGDRGERQFREDPGKVLRTAGGALAVSVVLIALGGLSPYLWLTVVCFGLSAAVTGIITPALSLTMMSVILPVMRPHSAGLLGLCAALGGLVGTVVLGGADERFGAGGAMVAIAVPGVLAALVIARAGRTVNADLDRLIDRVLEQEDR